MVGWLGGWVAGETLAHPLVLLGHQADVLHIAGDADDQVCLQPLLLPLSSSSLLLPAAPSLSHTVTPHLPHKSTRIHCSH